MSQTPAIEIKDLLVRLGDFLALDRVSFDLQEGAFLAIVGPNGSGKSTLLKTLLGVVPCESGSIRVLGLAPGEAAPGSIAYVPQLKTFDRSFPALAIELVGSGLRGTWPWKLRGVERERAHAALARAGAESLADRPVGKLSGGELQRVYLARAFAREPKLILLDEPATGIDSKAELDLHRILSEERARVGSTIVMVTHDLEVAAHHADRALLLHHHPIAFGPPETALTRENLQLAFGHVGHAHP